ncbi:MAG: hypothetical protein WCC37_18005 [Candidatus Sulfotelmatobacter sp.]
MPLVSELTTSANVGGFSSAPLFGTPGLRRALTRGNNRTVCACGLAIPRYVGKYPKKCPNCGTPLAVAAELGKAILGAEPETGEPTDDDHNDIGGGMESQTEADMTTPIDRWHTGPEDVTRLGAAILGAEPDDGQPDDDEHNDVGGGMETDV